MRRTRGGKRKHPAARSTQPSSSETAARLDALQTIDVGHVCVPCIGRRKKMVVTVAHVFGLRQLRGGAGSDPTTPQNALQVFNVTVASEIDVFFYDKWAGVMADLRKNDLLTITGPGAKVIRNPNAGGHGEHAFRIVCTDTAVMACPSANQQPAPFVVAVRPLVAMNDRPLSTAASTTYAETQLFDSTQPIAHRSIERAPPSKACRGSGDKYAYVSIADTTTRGENNVFGVVVSCTPPKPTKSVDLVSRMNIIDPSRPTLHVPVVVFARHPRQHPKCTQLGDVVRAHRLTLKAYQQSHQLVAKKTSSFVVVHADGSCDSTSATMTPFSEAQTKRIKELQAWAKQRFASATALNAQYTRRLGDLAGCRPKESADFVVCVAAISFPQSGAPCLAVWDGTGAATDSSASNVAPPRMFAGSEPKGVVVDVAVTSTEIARRLKSGNVVVGTWLLMRNAMMSSKQDFSPANMLVCHEATAIVTIGSGTFDVQERIKAYDDRCVREQGPKTVTWCAHSVEPITSIRDVLADSVVPNKYRVQGQVVGIWPQDIRKWTVKVGSDYQYRFALVMVDKSTRSSGGVVSSGLVVLASGAEAARFFTGIPPADLMSNTMTLQSVVNKVRSLCSQFSVLDVSVQAVKSSGPGGGSQDGVRRFHLFDTFACDDAGPPAAV